jgi:hypothetical protein
MKWNKTIANQCRYGEVAEKIWGTSEILWEQSYDDYQGEAEILALMPDGQLCFYEWTYGSCSGCDDWEARYLSDAQIEQEMRDGAVYFGTFDELLDFFRLPEQDFHDAVEVMQKMRGLEAHRYYFAREAVLRFIEQGRGEVN